MSVAAIIPTIGRPELVRAVESVLNQTVPVLPVVVLDRPDLADDVSARLAGLPHQLVTTSGSVGGAAARNLGVQSATQNVVAYLDDDDEWLPEKTSLQLKLLEASPNAAITSRAVLVGRKRRIVPEISYSNDYDMASYLLDRSTITLRKRFIQSSTLLMDRKTAVGTPWQDRLPRHQDWTLLIELRRHGVEIVTHSEPLVNVYQGSDGSISRSNKWRASEEWLTEYASFAKARARGDFLCSIAFRSAIAARDYRAAARLLAEAIPLRPHAAAIVVGVSEIARRG